MNDSPSTCPERLYSQFKDRAGNVYVIPVNYFSSDPDDEVVDDKTKLAIAFLMVKKYKLDPVGEPLRVYKDEEGRWRLEYISATMKSPGDAEGEFTGPDIWLVAGPHFDEVKAKTDRGEELVPGHSVGKFHSAETEPLSGRKSATE